MEPLFKGNIHIHVHVIFVNTSIRGKRHFPGPESWVLPLFRDSEAVEKYLTIKSVDKFKCTQTHNEFHNININCLTRWLDTVFQVQYLKSLSINYKALQKDLQKLPLQLCKMKMKSCYDQGCNDTGVVIGTN